MNDIATAILLAVFMAQNPGNSPAPGVVTGVVRSAAGTPASGVRVYYIAAGSNLVSW